MQQLSGHLKMFYNQEKSEKQKDKNWEKYYKVERKI